MGLLEDETLADLRVNGRSYTGLTTIVLMAPPEKYMDRMLGLLKNSNPAVRNAAVKNLALLIGKDSPEVVRALLPWLENPKWAKENGGERARLVEALQSLPMPESVPGLIAIMEEMQTVKRPPQRQIRMRIFDRIRPKRERLNTPGNLPQLGDSGPGSAKGLAGGAGAAPGAQRGRRIRAAGHDKSLAANPRIFGSGTGRRT